MDDCTFDLKTAQDWIQAIESAPGRRTQDIYPRINQWILRHSIRNVVDIGAGQGITCEHLNLDAKEYLGIEPSPHLVSRALQLYQSSNRNFKIGNAYDLPLPDGKSEAAFSILVWHLLSQPDQAAKELNRVLKPGGRFLLITANPDAYSSWIKLYTDIKIDGRRFEGVLQIPGMAASRDTLYLHTFEELKSSLNQAGLALDSNETFRKSADGSDQPILLMIEGFKP